MSNDFWQGCPDHTGGEQCFQYTLLGKLGFHMQKNEVAPSRISPIKKKTQNDIWSKYNKCKSKL